MGIIDVKNLSVIYPDGKIAVDNITFSLEKGEILGIIGESGSGKSTLALALINLLPEGTKLSGEVILNGQNILNLNDEKLRNIRGKEIGMVFQDTLTSFDPLMKVGKQIIERPLLDGEITYQKGYLKAVEILQELGVTQPKLRLSAYPHELSGGLRQRAFITMVLFQNPKILIFDEPTTSLDVISQAQFVSLIKKLREKGHSIIFITHDILLASSICDRVLIMYSGKIMEYGPTNLIFRRPAHPYTNGLLNAIPRISQPDRKLIPMKGFLSDQKNVTSGCKFWPRCDFAQEVCKKYEPNVVILGGKRISYCHFAKEMFENEQHN